MHRSLQEGRLLSVDAVGHRSVCVSGLPADELLAWLEKRLGGDFSIQPARWGRASRAHGRWELNDRELSILRLIALGRANKQIAQELFLSVNTIKSYIRAAYDKIGVTTRTQAILWALQRGLDACAPPDPPDPPDPPAQNPAQGTSAAAGR